MNADHKKQNPAGGPGFGRNTLANITHRNDTASGPLAMILVRLEKSRKTGKGYIAKCPAHADRSASLSLAEGTDGRVLLHCFAGCPAAAVLGSIGLSLADLYPRVITTNMGPVERRELRQRAVESNWRAAVNVLQFEVAIVELAAGQLLRNEQLDWDDFARLATAAERIRDARQVLQ